MLYSCIVICIIHFSALKIAFLLEKVQNICRLRAKKKRKKIEILIFNNYIIEV